MCQSFSVLILRHFLNPIPVPIFNCEERMRVRMGRFSLARLLTCARYERLTSEDYLRLGLCLPDSCPDCAGGQGHYVKNDKIMVSLQQFFL